MVGSQAPPVAAKTPAAPGLHHRTVARVASPSPEDLDLAREDALLQLRIGRSAHYYAVLVSATLALDGILVLFFPPSLAGRSWSFSNLYFLFPIVAAGLFLSIFALFVKWEEYQLWPWEWHFWTTVLAVVANAVAAYLYLAGLFAYGPTASWPLVPGLLPLAVGGIALAMAGLSLTWTSRSERQLASLLSALLPFGLAFVLFVPGLSHAALINALAVALLLSALLFQTSGSFLHLISSGTRAHEREMISSGQTRLFVMADEMRRLEDSLRLRESAVAEREAALADGEDSVKRRLEAHGEANQDLVRMEAEIRQRSEALAKEQTEWAAKAATAQNLWKAAEDKEADLARREAELMARIPGLSQREQTVAAQQGTVASREVELSHLQDEATRRMEVVRESEARLDARRLEQERRGAELLRQEAAFRSQQTMAAASEEERAASARRLAELEARETRLNQLQIELDDLRASVALNTEELTKSSQGLTEREQRHAQAEAELAKRNAAVGLREAEAQDAKGLAETRRQEFEKARTALQEREQAATGLRSDADRRLGDLQRRELALTEREQKDLVKEQALAAREAALDRRERESRSKAGPTPLPTSGLRPAAVAAPVAAAPVPEPTPDRGRRRLPDRASIGSPRMDDLLLGGLPSRSHVLLEGPPFSGKEVLLYQFLAEGLRRGEPVVMLAGGRPAAEVAQAMAAVLPEFSERQAKGQVHWVDVVEAPPDGKARTPAGTAAPAADPTKLLSSLVAAARRAEADHPNGFRVGALGFAHLFAGLEPAKGAVFFQNFVGILKPRAALAVYAIDPSLLPEALTGALRSRVDGVIEFRDERGKPQLAVRGLGDVETRDWVEYRSAPQGLSLGSFSLERIR